MDYTQRVVDFVKAGSDEELHNALVALQFSRQQMITPFQINKVGKFWYAWFHTDMKRFPLIGGELSKDKLGERGGSV